MIKNTLLLLLVVITTFAQAELEKLDEYIGKAVSKFEAAGLAVAVVTDSQIVFSKAYG